MEFVPTLLVIVPLASEARDIKSLPVIQHIQFNGTARALLVCTRILSKHAIISLMHPCSNDQLWILISLDSDNLLSGVLELEKRRPVDILQQMLEERSSNKMEQFFKSYGAAEVASMCFSLITSTPAGASAVSN